RFTPQPSRCADFPTHQPTRLPRDHHRPGSATLLRHPIACLLPTRTPAPTSTPKGTNQHQLAQPASTLTLLRGYGNINPFSIDSASRPRLRPRLTQGGQT